MKKQHIKEEDFIRDCKLVLRAGEQVNFDEVIKKELSNKIDEILTNKKNFDIIISDYYIINSLLEKIDSLFKTIEDDLLIPENKELYKGMLLNSLQNSASQAVHKTLNKFMNPHRDLLEKIMNNIG